MKSKRATNNGLKVKVTARELAIDMQRSTASVQRHIYKLRKDGYLD